jgi:hypothetical protein
MKAFITYDRLNAGQNVHSISKCSPKKLLTQIQTFLDTFTNCQKAEYSTLYIAKSNLRDLFSYSVNFGILGVDISGLKSLKKGALYFKIPEKKTDFAITILEQNIDSLLSIKWQFLFIDNISRDLLPNQDKIPILDERAGKYSWIYARISHRESTISPCFAFPYPDVGDINRTYILELQKHLPFQFSENSWRKWQLSSKGNWYSRSINGS